jgi:hypothetical protein
MHQMRQFQRTDSRDFKLQERIRQRERPPAMKSKIRPRTEVYQLPASRPAAYLPLRPAPPAGSFLINTRSTVRLGTAPVKYSSRSANHMPVFTTPHSPTFTAPQLSLNPTHEKENIVPGLSSGLSKADRLARLAALSPRATSTSSSAGGALAALPTRSKNLPETAPMQVPYPEATKEPARHLKKPPLLRLESFPSYNINNINKKQERGFARLERYFQFNRPSPRSPQNLAYRTPPGSPSLRGSPTASSPRWQAPPGVILI